ncbi:MAG: GDP-mannose 4,6-dehydratase [Acholeplasma sp.]|nr:GDP-mannose 4,6-dehydratase [Acholeplasma sp.]
MMKEEKYLVTGAAGFIGFNLSKRLLSEGKNVIGVDNLNDYYDVNLKHERLSHIKHHPNFEFLKIDIANKSDMEEIFKNNNIVNVINLAAQAGVRYSIENPDVYINSNIIGFYNILELCRHYPVNHLVYASSSSVYGANKKIPFEETDFVDNPVSLYAATKKSNELMAHTYSHLYKIPSTGLRFFTVYGPMGRPDMAYFSFTDKYFRNEAIKIFNNGDFENDLYRDFTYIDDIVEGIIRVIDKPPRDLEPMYRVLNIGNNNPVKLMEFINTLEKSLSKAFGKEIFFKKEFEPIKKGDVYRTYASIDKLDSLIGFKPMTSISKGLMEFSKWYFEFYDKSRDKI